MIFLRRSVLVENGETLINCLAYVDLNPVRAGIVDRPDDYRWSSFGYHQQNGNKDGFLSLDFGLVGTDLLSSRQRLCRYRQFVYGVGSLATGKGMDITEDIVAREVVKDFEVSTVDRFRARTRYFADSGIIGSRGFLSKLWQRLKSDGDNFDRKPIRIKGLEGLYSLKRLSELIC